MRAGAEAPVTAIGTPALLRTAVDRLRDRVVGRTTDLFAHAPYPLARSLNYPGDPGLFGPASVTWPVIGDVAAFVGGIRALLVQAAHPEVVAGVADHSAYRQDPLGRLSRTSAYVTAMAFGARPEIEHAAQVVRDRHRPVFGTSHRGRPYAADTPELAAWVHNALTSSFLVAYQQFGPARLSPLDSDRFVAEQTRVGALLDAAPLPESAADLQAWLDGHPHVAPSPGMEEVLRFLRLPPMPLPIRVVYTAMFHAAAATIPARLRAVLGLRRLPGALATGRAATRFLRWSLGSSPSWQLALLRVGAELPPGLFRQPPPAMDDGETER
jgi:uncharacterized protein (DUF2236 family)